MVPCLIDVIPGRRGQGQFWQTPMYDRDDAPLTRAGTRSRGRRIRTESRWALFASDDSKRLFLYSN